MMVASGAMAGMSRVVAGLPGHVAHHGTATHHHAHGLLGSGTRQQWSFQLPQILREQPLLCGVLSSRVI